MEDKAELTPLVIILNQLHKEGYRHNFKVLDDGRLGIVDGEESFTPEQVRIVNFYRFEGESNPGDEAILYVVETASGTKGTVVDAYGTYADGRVEHFMKQVQDKGKNLDR